MKMLLVQQALVVASVLAAEYEGEELLSRGPYEFQFRVDDPYTSNNYEVKETGDPNIVTGSYRTELPDGRTQVVSYEVHPERGYEAKVTYEGRAQYPDSPQYVATPYGPPEPLRPGLDKFKRESFLSELDGEQQRRDARKVEINYKNSAPNKIEKKVPETDEVEETDDDLSTSSTKVVLNGDAIKELDKKTQPKKKHEQKPQKNKVNKISDEILEEERDSFYDTHDTPQAEPLSLQQNNQQKNKAKKTEFRHEYKPSAVVVEPTTPRQEVQQEEIIFVPVIFEAVPTQDSKEEAEENEEEEDIADIVYTTDHNSDLQLGGLPLIELISPPPTTQLIVKNHRKRKIDSKDFYQGNANVQPARNHFRNFESLPTIYRSEIKFPAKRDNGQSGAVGGRDNIIHDHNQFLGNIGTDQYQHFYQTIFDEKLTTEPKTKERKVVKIKVQKPENIREQTREYKYWKAPLILS